MWQNPSIMPLSHALTSPGRRAAEPTASITREISEADLAFLAATERNVQPISIKRLSERHHQLARVLAGGEKPGVAAIICGYEPSRVSILQQSPAFKELIEFYRDIRDREFQSTFEILGGLARDAVSELASRLEEEPEKIGTGTLMELAKLSLDRSGTGPTSTQKTFNVNLNLSDRINEARERAKRAARGEIMIEAAE